MEQHDIVAGCAARIRDAAASGRALRIRGGGSKDWYVQSHDGVKLDTRAHHG
ncbi:glycolate oxidase subunit GlcE, partial [Burkholderia pseudomallei]